MGIIYDCLAAVYIRSLFEFRLHVFILEACESIQNQNQCLITQFIYLNFVLNYCIDFKMSKIKMFAMFMRNLYLKSFELFHSKCYNKRERNETIWFKKSSRIESTFVNVCIRESEKTNIILM